MIKTIIFDLGGVVLNRGLWLFREYLVNNYDVSDEDTINVLIKKYYKPYFSGQITEKEFWEKSLIDLKINANWKDLREKLLNFFQPNPGMFEILKKLRNNKYKLVLLSDQTNEWWPVLNKKFKIETYFNYCIVSAIVGINKPDKRIYELALKRSRSSAENSLFIDDLEDNLKPAEELGMKNILFKDVEQLIKELKILKIKIN